MSKPKMKHDFKEPAAGPRFSVRFLIAILLVVLGIAWIAYYYTVVRVDPVRDPGPGARQPAVHGRPRALELPDRLRRDHARPGHLGPPEHPAGRGRGVVIGMLGCFLVGLLWICTFYVFSDDISGIPVMNDLGQYNLVVGIALHGGRLHLRHPLGVS